MTASTTLKALFAGAATVALIGTAMAQGNPPNPAVKNAPTGAGQQSSQQTPMGTTGTPAGGAMTPGSTSGTRSNMGSSNMGTSNTGNMATSNMGTSSTTGQAPRPQGTRRPQLIRSRCHMKNGPAGPFLFEGAVRPNARDSRSPHSR
jgi:hypothetical protein